MAANVRVCDVRKLKIRRISTRREQNRRFYSDIVLRVRVKSAILRFKAQDEAFCTALNSDGHKHFVMSSYFYFIAFKYSSALIIGILDLTKSLGFRVIMTLAELFLAE